MLYLAIGLSFSLTNLASPAACFLKIFHYKPKKSCAEVAPDCGDEIPKTVEEMRKLIETLQENKKQSPLEEAVAKIVLEKKHD